MFPDRSDGHIFEFVGDLPLKELPVLTSCVYCVCSTNTQSLQLPVGVRLHPDNDGVLLVELNLEYLATSSSDEHRLPEGRESNYCHIVGYFGYLECSLDF